MNYEKLKEEDCANYSGLLNIQFEDFARSEIISNKEANERFLNCLARRS